jgi:hypothetical protein
MLDVFLDSMVRAGRIDGPAQPWLPPSHPIFEHTCLQPLADQARQRGTSSSQPRPIQRTTAWLLGALGRALVRGGQALEPRRDVAPTSSDGSRSQTSPFQAR